MLGECSENYTPSTSCFLYLLKNISVEAGQGDTSLSPPLSALASIPD